MEARTDKPGVVLDSIDEVIVLKDALDCLMDPESLEEAREAERKRKQDETGLEIVSIGFSSRDKQHAMIARAANSILAMSSYDEIFEVMQQFEPDQIAQMQSVKYLGENEANLAKFLLGAYAEVTKNELGQQQASGMISEIDEKLAKSREITATGHK
jgi:hypothetical protein